MGKHNDAKLLRKVAVELAMEFRMQDSELGKATWYPPAGHTVVFNVSFLFRGAEFAMECSSLMVIGIGVFS